MRRRFQKGSLRKSWWLGREMVARRETQGAVVRANFTPDQSGSSVQIGGSRCPDQ